MIAWSETKLKVRVVQPRRIRCIHCLQPFVYLATDEFEKSVRGLPYVSLIAGADGRRRRLLDTVEAELAKRSLQGKGEATCPHCRHKLPWMEATRKGAVISLTVGGLIGGWIAGWLLSSLAGWEIGLASVSGGVLGAALLGVVGSRIDIEPKPAEASSQKDLRSMDDTEWAHFAQAALRQEMDPAEAWWYVLLERRAKDGEAVLGLPPLDETREA